MLSPLVLAIPMYFLLMGVELLYERWSGRHTYRLEDAVTNINTGILNQITSIFFKLIKVGIYIWVYESFALTHLPENGWTFALLFVLWDFGYYWEHRLAHTVSLFWGGHSVHHQSEDYNLSVALRQSSTAFIWGAPIYLPLALLGFSPTHFVLVAGFNLLYQFWIHTEHIQRMPRWFEAIFNTPSHHRVHHGRNLEYLDKNYAGVFIIWDRLFGTFEPEGTKAVYGVTTPLASFNPVHANVAHYRWLFGQVGKARTLPDAARMLFKPPGWLPDYLGGTQVPKDAAPDYRKHTARAHRRVQVYVLVQFLFQLAVAALFFFQQAHWDLLPRLGFTAWLVWSSLMLGYLLEHTTSALRYAEIARWLLLPVLFALLGTPIWMAVGVLGAIHWVWVFYLPLEDPTPVSTSEPVNV